MTVDFKDAVSQIDEYIRDPVVSFSLHYFVTILSDEILILLPEIRVECISKTW